jgi:FtsH-binding integral membrane protein
MALGMGLTGFIAYSVSHNAGIVQLVFSNPMVFFGLMLAQLALVFSIGARVHKMHSSTATGLFILYSVLNGVALSFIFLVYTQTSVAGVFFITAATFVATSIYGVTTKRDLTSLGSLMFMGLIGIIISTLVNMFLRSSGMSMIISYIGVIVFVGLTAYDTQKLKTMALTQPADPEAGVVRKGAILGALSLYLDFINLFLMLLMIFGASRE